MAINTHPGAAAIEEVLRRQPQGCGVRGWRMGVAAPPSPHDAVPRPPCAAQARDTLGGAFRVLERISSVTTQT